MRQIFVITNHNGFKFITSMRR